MKIIKQFERFHLEEGIEEGIEKIIRNGFTSDRPKVSPSPQVHRRQPKGVYDGLENELKELLNGYKLFLTREEIIEIVKKVIKEE